MAQHENEAMSNSSDRDSLDDFQSQGGGGSILQTTADQSYASGAEDQNPRELATSRIKDIMNSIKIFQESNSLKIQMFNKMITEDEQLFNQIRDVMDMHQQMKV